MNIIIIIIIIITIIIIISWGKCITCSVSSDQRILVLYTPAAWFVQLYNILCIHVIT